MFWRSCAAALVAVIAWFGIPAATGAAVPEPSGSASASAEPTAFLRSAEALYEAAVKGSISDIRKYVRETESQLRSLPMQGIATAEGIEALARSVTRMKRTVASVSGNHDDWREPAAEIRLAADALAHPETPMWHQYRTVLLGDIERMEEAMGESGKQSDAGEHFEALRTHYGLIRTSVLLRSEPYVTERADSVLRYAERVLGVEKPDPRLYDGLIPSLRESMEGLFPGPQHDSRTAAMAQVAGPPWGWSALMGTFIVTILSWVGWQRYRSAGPVTPRGNLPQERHEHR